MVSRKRDGTESKSSSGSTSKASKNKYNFDAEKEKMAKLKPPPPPVVPANVFVPMLHSSESVIMDDILIYDDDGIDRKEFETKCFCLYTTWPDKHGRVFLVPCKKWLVQCRLLYVRTMDKSLFTVTRNKRIISHPCVQVDRDKCQGRQWSRTNVQVCDTVCDKK